MQTHCAAPLAFGIGLHWAATAPSVECAAGPPSPWTCSQPWESDGERLPQPWQCGRVPAGAVSCSFGRRPAAGCFTEARTETMEEAITSALDACSVRWCSLPEGLDSDWDELTRVTIVTCHSSVLVLLVVGDLDRISVGRHWLKSCDKVHPPWNLRQVTQVGSLTLFSCFGDCPLTRKATSSSSQHSSSSVALLFSVPLSVLLSHNPQFTMHDRIRALTDRIAMGLAGNVWWLV